MSIDSVGQSGIVASLAWMIVSFVWQATVLAALAWVALRISAPLRPATRYAIALGLFACLAAVPIVTAGRFDGGRAAETVAGPNPGPSRAVTADASVADVPPTVEGSTPLPAAPASPFDGLASAMVRVGSEWARIQQLLAEATASRANMIVLLWLIGALLIAARVVLDIGTVRGLRRAARGPLPPSLRSRVETWAQSLGLPGRVVIAQSSRVEVPLVIGSLAPLVLLPEALVSTMSTADAELLAAHELVHVKRGDYAVNLCQVAVETALFFHPVVWWMSARVRAEREHCCDQRVMELAGRAEPEARRRYIRALLTAEEGRSAPAPRLAPTSSRGSLARRAREILDGRSHERAGTHVYAAVALFATTSGILIYSPQPSFAALRVSAGPVIVRRDAARNEAAGLRKSAGTARYEIWRGRVERNAWLRVRNLVGSIVVARASGPQIDISTEGWRPKASSPLSFVTTREEDGVTICAVRPGVDCDENGNVLHVAPSELYSDSVNLIVRIPDGTNLLVASSDGTLIVNAKPENLRAQTGRGAITVRAAHGSVEAATGTGRVHIGDVTGDVVVRTGGGTVSLGRIGGDAEVRASSGDIDATLAAAAHGRWSFLTGSGSIRVQGTALDRARIEADATNGRVDSDFPYARSSRSSHSRADATPLAGSLLRASTSNGDISIKGR